MEDLAERNKGSCVVPILPYRLRALRRRQQAARAALFAVGGASPVPVAHDFYYEPRPMRVGIRHTASGRMTIIHYGLQATMAMLAKRAACPGGLLEDPGLEAIVLDGQKQVFAGFWPQ